MGEALYRKKGRRYEYNVTPDRAAWRAAAMEAKAGMVKAMQERAIATPEAPDRGYTPEQRDIVEKFRADMAAAGGLLPAWWTHVTAEQIADAGIAAVVPPSGQT